MALWIALLFVSSGLLTVTGICSKEEAFCKVNKIKRFVTFAFTPPVRYNVSDRRDFLWNYKKTSMYVSPQSREVVSGILS